MLGFLLFNVKAGFGKWFLKRFLRIYPALFAFTLFTVIIGRYHVENIADAVELFVYPTNYIFIVWLFVCYIVLYVVSFMDKKHANTLELFMLVILAIWIFTYMVFYDKTAYTADNVSEPFILFLYIESILIGAYFRKHEDEFDRFSFKKVIITIVCVTIYFISKIAVSKIEDLFVFQIVNQFVLIITLCAMFGLFVSLEKYLTKIPKVISQIVKYISNITLQIYFVQFVVIVRFEKLPFPASLIGVVVGIFVAATILYYVEQLIRKGISSIKKSRKCNLDAESTNQKN